MGTLESARVVGKMAYEWSLGGQSSDNGYFIARLVLGFLSLYKVQHARIALDTYLKNAGSEIFGKTLPYFDVCRFLILRQ